MKIIMIILIQIWKLRYLMGRKSSRVLVDNLCRDCVSIKILVGGNLKTQPQLEWNVELKNWGWDR